MKVVPNLAAAAALAGAVAGCAVVDAGRARICRSIVPALNASGSALEIVRTAPLAKGEGVRIAYRSRSEAGTLQDRFVECRFAAGGHASPERESITPSSGRGRRGRCHSA